MFDLLKNLLAQPDNKLLQQSVNDGAWLVDVRTPQEFMEGHLKGSVNIPLDQIPSRISEFKNKKGVIVFCRSGSRSAQAKTMLDQQGIENVLNGGAWQNVEQLVTRQM